MITRAIKNALPVVALVILLMVLLYSISDATSNSASFGKYYGWLMLLNAIGLVSLLAMIIYNVYKLIVQYRLKTIGSHLTARIIGVFVVLTIIPVSIVFYFSLSFLHRSIDSWFDVGIEQALEDSLQLGRSALNVRKKEALNKTLKIAQEIPDIDDELLIVYLNDARSQLNSSELTLIDHNQSIIASSSEISAVFPIALSRIDVGELSEDNHYLSLEENSVSGLSIRVVVRVQSQSVSEKDRTLQSLFPLTDRINELTEGVQQAFEKYKELAVLRTPLKTSFTLALTMIWLLSVLSAILIAFTSAKKLVEPINNLVEGTKSVAAGDYEKQLEVSGTDELGFLLRSFNTMTRKIHRSRQIAEQSQKMEAMQKHFLQSVMQHITSGVLTVDEIGFIKHANPAVCQIFGLENGELSEQMIDVVVSKFPMLKHFFDIVNKKLTSRRKSWQEEIIVFGPGGRKILQVRGTTLEKSASLSEKKLFKEQVVVVDDLTELIQAQKNSAWSEMARRLAHEIKNPLTPIQLSAERLRSKLAGQQDEQKQSMLDRYTHTIVQQVDAMKTMVNSFTDYARPPQKDLHAMNINEIIEQVTVLYDSDQIRVELILELDETLPDIEADAVRIRQLVHNLLKNAMEAIADNGWIKLQTRCMEEYGCRYVELIVEDNGSGISAKLQDSLFDLYVTTKNTGSGLGLAIVWKIVDEHGGFVRAENIKNGGARFIVRLPVLAEDEQLKNTIQISDSTVKQTGS